MKKWKEAELTQLLTSWESPRMKNSVVKSMVSCWAGGTRKLLDGFACVVVMFSLLSVELHEGDVQMPLEELWQGAEHGSRHPEAHPGCPPRVRQHSPPPLCCARLTETAQHPVPRALPASYSRGGPC